MDDILDVEGSEADLGKAVGADARLGKVTYVSTHGIEEARRQASEAHARALEALAEVPGPIEDLVGITDLTFVRTSSPRPTRAAARAPGIGADPEPGAGVESAH